MLDTDRTDKPPFGTVWSKSVLPQIIPLKACNLVEVVITIILQMQVINVPSCLSFHTNFSIRVFILNITSQFILCQLLCFIRSQTENAQLWIKLCKQSQQHKHWAMMNTIIFFFLGSSDTWLVYVLTWNWTKQSNNGYHCTVRKQPTG